METLKRVGEMNKTHWFVMTFGQSFGVLLWLIARSLNPFAWALVGVDTFICMLWMAPLVVLARFIGVPLMQGEAIFFYTFVGLFFVLGLVSLWMEIRYMDRNKGRPRPMFSAQKK